MEAERYSINAGELTENMGESLVGLHILTNCLGEWEGGECVITHRNPEDDADSLPFFVQRLTDGEVMGVLEFETVHVITYDPFREFLGLMMSSDPWPAGVSQDVLVNYANGKARYRGFVDWVDAYHRLCWLSESVKFLKEYGCIPTTPLVLFSDGDGELIPGPEFVVSVQSGDRTSVDGWGYYSMSAEEGRSRLVVDLDEVAQGMFDRRWTHVLWVATP